MSETSTDLDILREQIIQDPTTVLNDRDIMKALIAANNKAMGTNVIDLRSIALERLEVRLNRLEDTHRNVIAAAYDNLASTNQIHRAVLRVLEADEFSDFLELLDAEIAPMLNVSVIKLCLESMSMSPDAQDDLAVDLGKSVTLFAPGDLDTYISGTRGPATRAVTLRPVSPQASAIYGDAAGTVQSEALLRLNLGQGNLPAMIAMGSTDPTQFSPHKGTDLLQFLTNVLERLMQKWLG